MKLFRLLLLMVFILGLTAGACLPVGMAQAKVLDELTVVVEEYVAAHNPDWEGAELKITLGAVEPLIKKYQDQQVSFKVPEDFKLTKITPRLTLPIMVLRDGAEVGRGAITARIEVFREVVVARRKILKKQPLSSDDLDIKKLEVSLYPNKYFVDKNLIIGKISTTLIPEGAVLLQWMVKDEPVVGRGTKVKIVIRSEGLLVEAQGEALDDGQVGDIIKVRRSGIKQNIEAEIIGPGQVEVKI